MERSNVLYKLLASSIDARKRCKEVGNGEWFERHSESIRQLIQDFLPSGSGWDSGTKIDLDASHGDKLVLFGSFHHIHGESGMYDGWTEHTVTVTPSLIHNFHLRISGRNRNEIKEYLYDIFRDDLSQTVAWSEEKQRWIAEGYAKQAGEVS
jgi:hypothetical protein